MATRSLWAGTVLIRSLLIATARSAIVVSSVSPLRWLIIVRQPPLCANATASSVSVSVPDLVDLTRARLRRPSRCPLLRRLAGDEQVVADQLTRSIAVVRATQPSQPSSTADLDRESTDRRRAGPGVELAHLLGTAGLLLEGATPYRRQKNSGRHVERKRHVAAQLEPGGLMADLRGRCRAGVATSGEPASPASAKARLPA